MKEDFLNAFANIKRENSQALLEYLEKSDFFVAPSSTKFHSACEGGLCDHSVNVFNRLLALIKAEYGEDFEQIYSLETIAICGLLHDLCKINYYKIDYRNTKENGVWVQKPFYTIDDALPYGHGEKSVYIVNGFIRLSREEAMAINWHMGGFDLRVKGGSYSLSQAYEEFPLCLHLHIADMQASYLDEGRE
ncbi:MAG: hydrolase [Clostridia bacterium]